MEESKRRHRVPISERVKDIKKDSIKSLYDSIIQTMKEREVKATELDTATAAMKEKLQKQKNPSISKRDINKENRSVNIPSKGNENEEQDGSCSLLPNCNCNKADSETTMEVAMVEEHSNDACPPLEK